MAMTQLEDCSMWSHKAVAEDAPLIHEKSDSEAEARKAREKKLKDGLQELVSQNVISQSDLDALYKP